MATTVQPMNVRSVRLTLPDGAVFEFNTIPYFPACGDSIYIPELKSRNGWRTQQRNYTEANKGRSKHSRLATKGGRKSNNSRRGRGGVLRRK